MRPSNSIRLCLFLLVLCILWASLGAPLLGQEWQELPLAFHRFMLQWPVKTQPIWSQWLLRSESSAAAAPFCLSSMMLTVWDAQHERSMSIPLEDYVAGVTAAEMPAVYHLEALKCQAVAARTRVLSTCLCFGGNGCASHPDADVCTNSACCQAYLSQEDRYKRWGVEASVYEMRITQAVESTAGQLLTWNGMPIETLYHACSGGQTEDSAAVFSQQTPYLVSVDSPGEESYTGYETDTMMTCKEAADLLLAAFPDCGITEDGIPGMLRLQSTTSSGRIGEILVGCRLVTGVQFRRALGLRSTCCTWEAADGNITFHTRGYGHGVGMSQAGAQAMASNGADYRQILLHYYPGTVLTSLLE